MLCAIVKLLLAVSKRNLQLDLCDFNNAAAFSSSDALCEFTSPDGFVRNAVLERNLQIVF